MNDTDAVSCLLCLQADEYGSMIKVCVPPGQIPPSAEKVICRRCAAIITDATRDDEGEEIGRVTELRSSAADAAGAADPDGDAPGSDWDQGLPERAGESVVEVGGSEPENVTGSSKRRSARRVASEKTDE